MNDGQRGRGGGGGAAKPISNFLLTRPLLFPERPPALWSGSMKALAASKFSFVIYCESIE